jgi:hypothetical protein
MIPPDWQELALMLRRVIAVTGMGRHAAKVTICGWIADRRVKIRFLVLVNGNLQPLATAPEGNVCVPPRLVPGDFDWRRSRPRSKWMLTPAAMAPSVFHARMVSRDDHVMRGWREARIQLRTRDVEARLQAIASTAITMVAAVSANPSAPASAPAAVSAPVAAADARPSATARKAAAAKRDAAIQEIFAELQADRLLPVGTKTANRDALINERLPGRGCLPCSASTIARALRGLI